MSTQPPRVVLMTVVVILSVFAALLHPTTAFAQGEEPTTPAPAGETSQEETTPQENNDPPPSGEEQPPAAEEPPATGETGSEATPPGEENPLPPAGDETAPGAPPAGEELPQAPISEVVEALAETQTVLTDAEGNPLPLASEAAALALSEPDPYFNCSNDNDGTNDGVCHYTGANGIIEALADFTARGGSGMITIENGSFNGNFFINNVANLTGLSGAGVAATTINGFINIQNMAGNFTLQGFTINGSITATGGSGLFTASNLAISSPGGDGLNVSQAGSILVQNVDASNNKDRGAFLNAGNVTVRNSTFLGNGDGNYNALEIDSGGAVTLDKIQVKNNDGSGAQIDFGTHLTINDSQFWNNTSTADNRGYGLRAENPFGQGNIQISGSSFQQNTLSGAYLYTSKGNITVASSANNASQFTGNGAGLYAETRSGGVSLQNILVKDNIANGAQIAQAGTGAVLVGSSSFIHNNGMGLDINASGDVTINGANYQTILSQNGAGARVTSNTGKVTLNNVSSTANSGTGIEVFNSNGTKDVILTNVISGSNAAGILVDTRGAVTFNQVYANRNSNLGAIIAGAPPASMKAVTITNSDFNLNHGNGLAMQAWGLITLHNVSASGNTGIGARLVNDGLRVPAGVTILGTLGDNLFNNNSGPGLYIKTDGALSITNSLVSGNGSTGLSATDIGGIVTLKQVTVEKTLADGILITGLNNMILTDVTATNNTGPGITLSNSAATQPKTITLTNVNANANLNVGLNVNATGQLTLNNISASGNAGPGASLLNTSGAVNITNGFFDSNNAPGLSITTPGALTLNTISASGNTGGGGLIVNNGTSLSITKSNFDHNSGPGLEALNLTGAMTLNTVDASYNGSAGANLANHGAALAANATITNAQFDSNNGIGLQTQSKGAISLGGVSASGNSGPGMSVNNLSGATTAGLTLTNVHADKNTFGPGINLQTNGKATLNILTAHSNFSQGLTGITGSITITQGAFNANGDAGIGLNANGSLTLNGVTTSNNIANGANLSYNGSAAITKSSFDRNAGTGLVLTGNGAITLNTVSASFNTTGATLSNTTAGKITLTNTQVNRNYGPGLTVTSSGGVITATNLSVSNNLATGATFQNNTGGTTNGITLTNAVFDQNTGAGALINSNGAVLNTQVNANGNDGGGLIVNTAGSYTLSKGSFNRNTGTGIIVTTQGVINISNISATHNGVMGGNFSSASGAVSNLNITKGDFSNNTGDGLAMAADGNITLNGITANANSGAGMIANAMSGTGTITLLGAANYASNNSAQGLRLTANNQITLNNTFANGNGITADLDGAHLSNMNNSPVVIKGGSFSGNGRNGIRTETGTGTLTLHCVTAIGNDVTGGSADPNINPTGAVINTCP